MKTFLLIACFFLSAIPLAQANEPPPGTVVALYECGQVNPALDHFTCRYSDSDRQFNLEWLQDVSKLPTQERHLALYHFSKLELDIVQYGNFFQLTWAYGKKVVLHCSRGNAGYTSVACY